MSGRSTVPAGGAMRRVGKGRTASAGAGGVRQ